MGDLNAQLSGLMASLGGGAGGALPQIPNLGAAAGLDVTAALAQLTGSAGAGGLGMPNLAGLLPGAMPDFSALSSLLAPPVAAAADSADQPDPECLVPLGEKEMNLVRRVLAKADEPSPDPAATFSEKRPEGDAGAVYFVLTAPNLDALHLSVETGLWAVGPEIEKELTKAYHEHSYVGLIFTIPGSDAFMGYGYMAQIRGEDGAADASEFRVSWSRIGSIPFALVPHIANDLDGDRPVAEAGNGQRLSKAAGVALCNAIDAAAIPLAQRAGVSKFSKKKPSKKVCFNVQNMDFEKYVVTVLTKRRQRLRAARKLQQEALAKAKKEAEEAKEKEKEAAAAAATASTAAAAAATNPPQLDLASLSSASLTDLLKAPGAAELLASLTAPAAQ